MSARAVTTTSAGMLFLSLSHILTHLLQTRTKREIQICLTVGGFFPFVGLWGVLASTE